MTLIGLKTLAAKFQRLSLREQRLLSALGIFVLGEPASALRMLAAVLIISGLVLMKVASN